MIIDIPVAKNFSYGRIAINANFIGAIISKPFNGETYALVLLEDGESYTCPCRPDDIIKVINANDVENYRVPATLDWTSQSGCDLWNT